jgi:type II secretory ATPase GspE/PulE/Tfp pilus assembly ATPase PilB-like protein
MTGHLVLSTLHTNDAATTLPRFRDMDIEPFLIASSINLIIAQRLVRKICDRCIVSSRVDGETLKDRVPMDAVKKHLIGKNKDTTVSLYAGKGCERCGETGYRGRIGVFEVMEIDDELRELIMSGANAKVLTQKAIANGMTTMFEDGLRKVAQGLTTIDEVMRVTGGD